MLRSTVRAATGLLVATLAVPALWATTAVERTENDMVQEAAIIVTGHCTHLQSQWAGKTLVTLATIQVSEVLKGDAGSQLTVVLPGGVDSNRRIPVAMSYPAAPEIFQQENVLLFLTPEDLVAGGYSIVGFSQGKFSLAEGKKVATQDLSGLNLQGRTARSAAARARRSSSTSCARGSGRPRPPGGSGDAQRFANRRRDAMRGTFVDVRCPDTALAALLAAALGSAPALAGGFLETLDITGRVPSPVPGHINARFVRIFHDPRCIPVQWRVNNTQDPIPNPLGAPILSLADATTAFQKSFDAWNQIPTSYINEKIVGTVANPGLRGFDMVNELTFRTGASFGAIASSPSVSLIVRLAAQQMGMTSTATAIPTCRAPSPPAGMRTATAISSSPPGSTRPARSWTSTSSSTSRPATASASRWPMPASTPTPGRWTSRRPPPTNSATPSACRTCSTTRRAPRTAPRRRCSRSSTRATRPPSSRSARSTATTSPSPRTTTPRGRPRPARRRSSRGIFPFGLVYGLIKGSATHGVFGEPIAGASLSATNVLNGELLRHRVQRHEPGLL